MYRQGDILIKQADIYDKSVLEEILRDGNDRIILAYGEVTGHAHAIKNKNAVLMRDKTTNKIYLMIVSESVDLVHEEHTKITLPPGNYEVKRQREYTPERIIYVAD